MKVDEKKTEKKKAHSRVGESGAEAERAAFNVLKRRRCVRAKVEENDGVDSSEELDLNGLN